MIYVYAITDRPEAPLPRQLGLQDAATGQVVWRDVVAIVSEFDGSRLSKTARRGMAARGSCGSAYERSGGASGRFGTLSPSRQHVGDMLRRANRALVQDIERVRGQVEIGMRFLTAIEDNGAEDASSGSPHPSAHPP